MRKEHPENKALSGAPLNKAKRKSKGTTIQDFPKLIQRVDGSLQWTDPRTGEPLVKTGRELLEEKRRKAGA